MYVVGMCLYMYVYTHTEHAPPPPNIVQLWTSSITIIKELYTTKLGMECDQSCHEPALSCLCMLVLHVHVSDGGLLLGKLVSEHTLTAWYLVVPYTTFLSCECQPSTYTCSCWCMHEVVVATSMWCRVYFRRGQGVLSPPPPWDWLAPLGNWPSL